MIRLLPRPVLWLMSVLMVMGLGAACTAAPMASPAAAPETTVIDVYIESDTNISDWWSNSIKPDFETTHPGYELNIIHTGSGGGGNGPIADRAMAALETEADPGSDYFETFNPLRPIGGLDAGLWQEIAETNVPNLANVIDSAMGSSTGFDIPYRGSQVLLAYNEDRLLKILKEGGHIGADDEAVPAEFVPSTWPELIDWVCAFPGEFIYPRPDTTGAGREFVTRAVFQANGLDPSIFSTAAYAAAYGSEELTAEQIAEINDTYFAGAWDQLNEIEPCLYDNGAYPSGSSAETRLLVDDLVTMITIWSDQALQAQGLGLLPPNTRFIQLEDLPMVGGYATSVIPSNARDLEGALLLANYLLSPAAQESVVRVIGGFPAISWDLLPSELQEDFNDVITDTVPSFSGSWRAAMFDGWYTHVAPDVERE